MTSSEPVSNGKDAPPMDKDYEYYIAKYTSQPPPPPPPRKKYGSNLGVVPMEPVMEQVPREARSDPEGVAPEDVDGDEALLDLAQLEELHHEAERMKALGNKHMAAQEYTRAYNAYSAALQLSPVGPSSHVFLSNRSAALLSLKRYTAAATDARRAIALAPTFGKAHARLGQAMYFLKDYEGAVAAYEDAIQYEPDNPITKTYLEKAKAKWDRQREKHARSTRGEEISVLTENSSVQATVINSVATDPNAQAAVVQTMGFRGQSNAMSNAVVADDLHVNDSDPDFDEALRIQERANRYLANKNYKYAIEEYTAALFLVPDDYNLSPDLHLGRAHALNGSRRHDSAKIDAELAIKIKPTPEAYSTLAKSMFYMKDYQGAIDAFGQCKAMLPEGEPLSMFDRAYLQKSEAALQDSIQSEPVVSSPARSQASSSTPIPKLKPPRFVPREEALSRTPTMPSMPKSWPQQTAHDNQVLHCGSEREVLFLSEALGIKLNRGPDGVVRVIDVSPNVPGSPIARQGTIQVGDVVREAAGVDLRRPITNIMWGDTVALIKMAPRPIALVVAEELNRPRFVIADQRKAAAAKALSPTSAAEYFPSNSSGDESVRDLSNTRVAQEGTATGISIDEAEQQVSVDDTFDDMGTDVPDEDSTRTSDETGPVVEGTTETLEEAEPLEEPTSAQLDSAAPDAPQATLRDTETEMLGAEIFFPRTGSPQLNGWDNLRWMAHSGARTLRFVGEVYKFVAGRRTMFWNGDQYHDCKLAVYDDPCVWLMLRYPENTNELNEIMDLPPGTTIQDVNEAMRSYLVVEAAIDPKMCKLKLSPLTTITSILPDVPKDDHRRRSCFELITPTASIPLSAVRLRKGAERALTSFTDSGAFLETSAVEHALQKSMNHAHSTLSSIETADMSWTHQVVLGTLHSYIFLGNVSQLDKAIACAYEGAKDETNPNYLDSRVIDSLDASGRTALHYACTSRFSAAVVSLLKAGASPDTRCEPLNRTPCHLSALHLDAKSLRAILSANRRPNVVDSDGRTPLHLAIIDGRSVGGSEDASAVKECISVLTQSGSDIEAPLGYSHPICQLATVWRHEALAVLLKFCNYRYPILSSDAQDKRSGGISVDAAFQYPIHACLVSLRKLIVENGSEVNDWPSLEKNIIQTLAVLFRFGFEPNERFEGLLVPFTGSENLVAHVGFAPIQILAAAALDIVRVKEELGGTNYLALANLLSKVSGFLIMHGGRVALEPPPTARSKDRRFLETTEAAVETESLPIQRLELKITENQKLVELLGIRNQSHAEKVWNEFSGVESCGIAKFHTDKLAIPDSLAPGGSDSKTCAICWKPFGTITNRKHRCRISRRHVCEECSTKRVKENGEDHRVSDGQFLLARADAMTVAAREQHQQQDIRNDHQHQVPRNAVEARLERLEAEEAANRDSLFGNIMGNVTKAVFGEEDQGNELSQAESVHSLTNQLNQTKDMLVERGDKLNTLAEKSDKLVNASKDFASMAKELNRQTPGGFFW
eukprot:Nitzschia sp. Nitz4//scaffold156_size52432//26049//30881//NITZ4_006827-RA/size52432-snap-gene-0.13-mRNA-1//-1//CDS//3329537415//9320//frame0